MLSILIPTFNRDCTHLVQSLKKQADHISGLQYEVLVVDDASTDEQTKRANRIISQWANCAVEELPQNIGRASIRNLLAKKAQYAYLLFLDSDVQIVNDDYLRKYLQCEDMQIVYGGVCVLPSEELAVCNLRYQYELSCEAKFTVEQRSLSPYQGFRTSNFLVRKDLMLRQMFDERIKHYGYEDVLYGRCLKLAGITVTHIDNAVAVDDFEPNDVFLKKTDEGIHTLLSLSKEMDDYIGILIWAKRIERMHVDGLLLAFYNVFSSAIKRNLLGTHPNVKVYNVYRLCTYLRLDRKVNK